MKKVYLTPPFRNADGEIGGISRVCAAMVKHLPAFGYEVTDRMEGADLMHAHVTLPHEVPTSLPLVVSNHGLYWAGLDWPEWAYKLNGQVIDALRRADHVTACSAWVAQVLRRGMWLDPTILYHGVDAADWDGGTNEGYLLWDKAYAHAVSTPEPVNELARRLPDLRFVSTFGDAAPNVTLTGRVPYPEAAALTRNAGLYLATTRETFGISILQALAAGVPVVGWRWGGAREIVQHGVTGWLATPGDYAGLIEGIRWALAHRAQIGEAARADVAERWTWETAMARYADLYDWMLDGAQYRLGTPTVSVIVPCYNLGAYLPEALASVRSQTLTDWECIVVDDASTDDSAAIAAEAAATDSRFTVLRNDRNQHVSATRNRGMAAARGRYLLALDADDRMTPDTLRLLADALDRDRGIGIAYGGLQLMSESGELRNSLNEWPGDFSFRDQVQGRNQVPTLCMFRRELFERTGGYRSRLIPVEDADLWTRMASIGGVPRKVTQAATLLYRLRPASISRTMPQREWAPWYPWSRTPSLTPFAAACEPPGGKPAWPVPSYEPVRVSVIIPVGPGHERVLVDALDSVEAQTERQWECIVVNDTGAPLPWVPSWAKVLESPKAGSGPAVCRNIAIAASTAPVFVPLDADDYLEPEALETLLAAYREHGGVIYSQWWDHQGESVAVYDPPAYDAKLLTRNGCISGITALYPKAAWETVGGFDEALTHWEDWDFWLSLAKHGVCGTKIDAPLWTYRKREGNRREANLSAFEDGKRAILAKWAPYWEGRETLMACRSCGGTTIKPPPAAPRGAAPAAQDGLTLLEFTGPSTSTITFKGQATGTQYRFGNSESHRAKYVRDADVPGLLALAGKFRVAGSPGPAPAAPVLETPERATAALPAPPAMGDAYYWALRGRLRDMGDEEIALLLATERAADAPRENVVKLLDAALRKEGELVGA